MAGYYSLNGKFFPEETVAFSVDNRSFRYGDGLFETLRVRHGKVPLWDYHIDRLLTSLNALQFILPAHLTSASLHKDVELLLAKNKHTNARVRISFYRGDGGLTDPIPQTCGYLIQTWPIQPDTLGFNTNGLHIGTYTAAQKSTDFLANLKSANYLPYVMASLFAKEQKWNDALVINHQGRVADTCIANVCWIQNGDIFTTPLSEGPVNGVMRRYLTSQLPIIEKAITPADLAMADELFLTNAVKGIQWVGMIDGHRLPPPMRTMALWKEYIQPLFG